MAFAFQNQIDKAAELRRRVRARFLQRCTYCQSCEAITVATFEVEHFQPLSISDTSHRQVIGKTQKMVARRKPCLLGVLLFALAKASGPDGGR